MKKLNLVLLSTCLLCMLFAGCEKKGTVTDIDGNVYQTVVIGGQEWMAENLRTARYRDGIAIPNVQDNAEWENATTGAWSNYNHDAANDVVYGKLYNWYAVEDSLGLCPEGWHVPSDDEWSELIDTVGGDKNAGCTMKETGTSHWESPNTCATNKSGFTGLPGGYRDPSGFVNLGRYGAWWSTAENNAERGWFRILNYNNSNVYRLFQSKTNGVSVRCVRD